MPRFRLVTLLMVFVLLVAACSPAPPETVTGTPTPSPTRTRRVTATPTPRKRKPSGTVTPKPTRTRRPTMTANPLFTKTFTPHPTKTPRIVNMTLLQVAVLPDLDALPLFVAKSQRLFEARGLEVLIFSAATAAERDAQFQNSQVDGLLTDLLSVILANQGGSKLKVIGDASRASNDAPRYYLLASEKSGITTLAGLKGVGIGLQTGAVDEYIATRILQEEGLSLDEIVTLSIPAPEDRLTLLASGQLEAALLPEPIASQAIEQGAVVIANDSTHPSLARNVYAFSRQVIEEKPEAVREFIAAIEEAVELINANPDKFQNTVKNRGLLPPSLADTYKLPAYLSPVVPGQEEWEALMLWAKTAGLISVDVPYSVSVLSDFLP